MNWHAGMEGLMDDLQMGPCHFGRLEEGQRVQSTLTGAIEYLPVRIP